MHDLIGGAVCFIAGAAVSSIFHAKVNSVLTDFLNEFKLLRADLEALLAKIKV